MRDSSESLREISSDAFYVPYSTRLNTKTYTEKSQLSSIYTVRFLFCMLRHNWWNEPGYLIREKRKKRSPPTRTCFSDRGVHYESTREIASETNVKLFLYPIRMNTVKICFRIGGNVSLRKNRRLYDFQTNPYFKVAGNILQFYWGEREAVGLYKSRP